MLTPDDPVNAHHRKPVGVRRLARIQCLAWLMTSCGVSAEEGTALGSSASGAVLFRVAPLALDQIHGIVPLGNLNPQGGHVFPSDHLYLDYGDFNHQRVVAPAAGTVLALHSQIHGGSKVEVQADESVVYYLAHVELRPEIQPGTQLRAGQPLGEVSEESWLDFGAYDARTNLPGFIRPERYPVPTRRAISPLALYGAPLSGKLYSKVAREGQEKDGRIDLDQPGKLVGNWFHESLALEKSAQGDPQVWTKQLAFAYDVRQPTSVRVSIGGVITAPGLYAIHPGEPDPASVSVTNGLVTYHLSSPARAPDHTAPPRRREESRPRLLLVQMLTATRLRAEVVEGQAAAQTPCFSPRAAIYER